MTRTRAWLALVSWTAVLVATEVGLAHVHLPASRHDPVLLTMSVLRTFALAAGAYLLVTIVVGLLGRLARAHPIVAACDTVTVPAMRRLLVAAAGATMLASTALAWPVSGASAATSDHSGPPVMVAIPDGGFGADAPPSVPTTLAPAPPAPPVPVPGAGKPGIPKPSTDGPGIDVPVGATTAVVQRGDSLWSLAAHGLEQAWGRRPTPAEIVPYWRDVIDRNSSRFVRGGDPNVIFAGQVMDLPTPPPAPP